MAYNGFTKDLKAANYIDGQVGNVRLKGTEVHLDFMDATLPREELEVVLGHVITIYVNNNNKVNTGNTMLKVFGYGGGAATLKVVYNAGPSAGIEDNLKFTWLDESE